jgi:hypothetical protein
MVIVIFLLFILLFIIFPLCNRLIVKRSEPYFPLPDSGNEFNNIGRFDDLANLDLDGFRLGYPTWNVADNCMFLRGRVEMG